MAEELDAVVLVGIVRSAQDNAGVGAQRASDVGNAGSRKRPNDEHIHTERGDPGHQRRFEHVAGKAGVFADDNLGAGPLPAATSAEPRDDVGGRASKFEGGFRSDGFDIGNTANAVSAEDFARRSRHEV